MNKETIRVIQFIITSILIFITFVGGILGIILLLPLVLAVLMGFLMKSWDFFWKIIIIDAVLLTMAFSVETLTFKIVDIFGKYFEENTENEKIFQEYENWFYEWYQNEYEKYGQSEQEQENQQAYGTYYSSENIIEKIKENLKVLGLEPSQELSLQDIKRAHRVKAKEFHPDKNQGKDTTADMQRINAAKEYLDANLEYYLSKIS